MDTAAASSSGGGPAPFLLKTYEMVDDSTTDEIVSWSPRRNSFIVWNPPEFARLLLPTYFKHSNFSSFIRQLNTYGFRKIDPERWEFCNEEFIKDQKHLLKNIHRRKPIHSHSIQPQQQLQQANNSSSSSLSAVDAERASFGEEIKRLSHEKSALESKLSRLKQEQSTGKIQMEELSYRMTCMDRRQEELLIYLEKAVKNPSFVENLAKKIESVDFSAYNKKRRLPHTHPQVENGSPQANRNELGISSSIFPDFTDRLRLELSSVVSDINLVSHSTQSSNEQEGLSSPPIQILESDEARNEGILFAASAEEEVPELSDTGTSFMFMKMDSVLAENQRFQETVLPSQECETSMSCQLNLSLASSPLQLKTNNETNPPVTSDLRPESPRLNAQVSIKSPSGQGRVNDVFWEQFLTEKPVVSYIEESDRRFVYGGVSKNAKSMERLTL